jgi:predicted TIM-barrel fold metal-dependent hydrolase
MNARQIVDTHQHLWDLDLFRYSWLQNVPVLNRSFRMSDYQEATRGLEVVKSVHLEADVDAPYMLAETQHLLKLCDQPGNPLGGIVACARPENDDFHDHIGKIAGHPQIKGIRRVLHTQPDELGRDERFVANVGSLAGYGLSFDICVLARQLPVAIGLVSRCPEVTFILDHCGVPQVKEKILDPWRGDIAQLAQYQNVFCKVSGLVAYADPLTWTVEDLRPYIEHVIERFGWERVLFGSDWPVCTLAASFARWVQALTEITASCGDENQRKLFHDNAVRVYRL